MVGLDTLNEIGGGRIPPIDEEPGFPGDDGGGDSGPQARHLGLAGLVVGMMASAMTFFALGTTLLLRRNLSEDWISLPVPRLLWVNTLVLLASSVALETARRALSEGQQKRFSLFWSVGTVLGGVFLIGQTWAWWQLARSGVYMTTNPSHSFFYILTSTHAVHAIAGLIALVWIGFHALRFRLEPRRSNWVSIAGLFWHFLVVMWLGLMGLFLGWG